MTSIRVTRSDMASECESRLFWSIFFLSRVAPSASFSTLTVTPSPVVKRSLGTPLILYSQSIYFRGSLLEFLSFPPCYALATACLCDPPEFIHPTPFQTRHGSLVSFCLSLSFFFLYFLHILFALLCLDSSPFDTSNHVRGMQCKICSMHQNKIIYSCMHK